MTLNLDAITNGIKLIEQARLARPLLAAALDAIINDFGPELARAFQAANDFWTDEKARSFTRLKAAGFTREEALLLVCDAEAARQRLLRQIALNGPKAKPPVGSQGAPERPQPGPEAA